MLVSATQAAVGQDATSGTSERLLAGNASLSQLRIRRAIMRQENPHLLTLPLHLGSPEEGPATQGHVQNVLSLPRRELERFVG